METVASGMDAPDGSVTNPERVAPATWASDCAGQNRFKQSASTTQVIKPTAALIPFWIVIGLLVSWLGSFLCRFSENKLCGPKMVQNPHFVLNPSLGERGPFWPPSICAILAL